MDGGLQPAQGESANLQHPATHEAWAWFNENREKMPADRAERIDAALREVSSIFWEWDQEAQPNV